MAEVLFALLITGKEARSGVPGNPVVGAAGEKYWVTIEPDGWVEATSRRARTAADVPEDIKPFATVTDAENFANRWKGHPWWCIPCGYEVIPVIPVYEQRQVGWTKVNA